MIPQRVPERAYTDEELDAAIAAITQPGAINGAEELVMRAAPQLQQVLAAAMADGGWFDTAHEAAVGEASGEADAELRLRAITDPARRGDPARHAGRRGGWLRALPGTPRS